MMPNAGAWLGDSLNRGRDAQTGGWDEGGKLLQYIYINLHIYIIYDRVHRKFKTLFFPAGPLPLQLPLLLHWRFRTLRGEVPPPQAMIPLLKCGRSNFSAILKAYIIGPFFGGCLRLQGRPRSLLRHPRRGRTATHTPPCNAAGVPHKSRCRGKKVRWIRWGPKINLKAN